MQFKFTAKRLPSLRNDPPKFQVHRIWADGEGKQAEVSHLIDRTYAYSSLRELQWHLAERFSRPAQSVSVSAI
jgi:hypothetical protein